MHADCWDPACSVVSVPMQTRSDAKAGSSHSNRAITLPTNHQHHALLWSDRHPNPVN